MDKKIVYIGIGLLVLAILMIFVAPSVAFQFNTSTFNTTLKPNQTLSVPINLTKLSIMLIVYQANYSINFFVLNNSAYSAASKGNFYSKAVSHEGNGTLEIELNTLSGTFPEQLANASAGDYVYKNATLLPAGRYYLVFQGNAINSTPLAYQINTNNSFSSNLLPISIIGLIFIIGLVGGIIAIGYGLMKKGDSAKDVATDAQAQQAYAQMDGKGAAKTKARKAKKSSS